jgi:hypothetical protein
MGSVVRVWFAAAAARPGAMPRMDRRVRRDGDGDGVAIVSLPSSVSGIYSLRVLGIGRDGAGRE